MRVGVLASGTGTILEAMLAEEVPVAAVFADRGCRALEIAADRGIGAVLVDRAEFGGFTQSFDRDAYTDKLVQTLFAHRIDLVAMAGFGTILGKAVHDAFPHRVLNTHPALLPNFPGWHAVRDALAAGVDVTGCTVHLAEVEVDSGPILAQEEVPVLPDDDENSLHERIKAVERRLYPSTIRAVIEVLERGGDPAQLRGRVDVEEVTRR